jgi:hypothetical protein
MSPSLPSLREMAIDLSRRLSDAQFKADKGEGKKITVCRSAEYGVSAAYRTRKKDSQAQKIFLAVLWL